jgi:hypothetical protein
MMVFYVDQKKDDIVMIINSFITNSSNRETTNISLTLEAEIKSIEYYDWFISAYDEIQTLLKKNEIRDFSFIKERSGFLYYGSFYQNGDENLLEYSKRLRRLKEIAGSDSSFVFISPPEKDSSALVNLENAEIITNSDRTQDEFLLYLQYMEIDALDLREIFKKSDYSYEQLYYKTDRHWSTLAAFETFRAIADKLRIDYGETLDAQYTDINNYQIDQYDDMMIGTIAKEIGHKYTELDDFILITPKFQTDYRWEFKRSDGETGSQEGSFEESLLIKDKLEIKNGLMEMPYAVYLNRINGYDKITNKKNPDGLKILCVRDAYFSPVATFLMPYCSELHLISPFDSEINIEDYVEKNKFDYVLIEYYPGKINNDGFPFFDESDEVKTE